MDDEEINLPELLKGRTLAEFLSEGEPGRAKFRTAILKKLL